MSDHLKFKCNICQVITNHKELFRKENNFSDDNSFDTTSYDLMECLGCENIRFVTSTSSTDFGVDEKGNLITDVVMYPPNTLRSKPKWISSLRPWFISNAEDKNVVIVELIDEIYIALEIGMSRLAVMGIRALMEEIMIKQVGDQGSFVKNIRKFQEGGFISSIQRSALDSVIETGHAANHRGFKPNPLQVQAAIDIVENIIESIYVSDKNKQKLPDIPPRKIKR